MTAVMQAHATDEIQAIVRGYHPQAAGGPLRAVAGRTKPTLAADGGAALDVSPLAGLADYQPEECTFTARAATPLADIEATLRAHGHYLPFDPPFAPRGATLGGTVASALSGPGRYRYGGVRDFLLGVRFVDGEGRLIRGGGRVVKNAAGFYLHHLQLGALGRLGVMTELTFKVFPAPAAQASVVADFSGFDGLLDRLTRLRRSTFEIESIEIVPPVRMIARLGGTRAALAARLDALASFVRDGGCVAVGRLEGADEVDAWREARELTWAPQGPAPLVKVATTPGGLARLEPALAAVDAPRRYGVGGDVAWVSWSRPIGELDRLLGGLRLPGLAVLGDAGGDPHLGVRPDAGFLARVARTFDPRGVFGAVAAGAAAEVQPRPGQAPG